MQIGEITRVSEWCWTCAPLKAINAIPSVDELKALTVDGYDRCLAVTQETMLDDLGRAPNGITLRELLRLREYAMKYGANMSWESWGPSMRDLMDAMFALLLHVVYQQPQTRTLLITRYPWRPACGMSGDWMDKFIHTARECIAYSYTGMAARGVCCCRGGTRITPEGYASVCRVVTSVGWRACEIPSDGHRCCMVLVPWTATAYFFDKWTGALMQNGVMRLSHRAAGAGVTAAEDVMHSPDLPSVFECSYKPATNAVRIYDCMVCNGNNVRDMALSLRLRAAAEVTNCWCSRGESSRPITVLAFAPPRAVIRAQTAEMVLFVREDVPYPASMRPGGDAFLWKRPSLERDQVVLVCRVGRAMAAFNRNNVLLHDVGQIDGDARACVHMGAYVCELVQASPPRWRPIRPARRAERLSWADECARPDQNRASQVSREDMMKLLAQMSPE